MNISGWLLLQSADAPPGRDVFLVRLSFRDNSPIGYDTVKTNPALKWVGPAYVTFSIGADGKVDRVTMKAVSPAADFSWDYQDLLFTPEKAAR